MIKEWQKFKGWSVLEYFLLYPNTRSHVNKLSRELEISPQTAQRFCNQYSKDRLLKKIEIGNIHQYYLNEDDERIRILKQFMGPYLIADEAYLKPFLEKNKNVLSIAIYGSFTQGDYGDKSDLDVLILTADERKPKTGDLAKIELKLGREIGITIIILAKWREMERKKDNFFTNIKNNNRVIWGNSL